jgi:hypothetical protein
MRLHWIAAKISFFIAIAVLIWVSPCAAQIPVRQKAQKSQVQKNWWSDSASGFSVVSPQAAEIEQAKQIQKNWWSDSARGFSVKAPLRAAVEEGKIRAAESSKIYQYERITLTKTTAVRYSKAGKYSARAHFSVQGENVAIRCVSPVRAVVDAFLEYIKSFLGIGLPAEWSLEQIVSRARQDLRNRGFSDADITLTYINQFKETHVVEIERHKFQRMVASR